MNVDRFVMCEVIRQTLGASWFNFRQNKKHGGVQCLTQPAHADGSSTTIEQLYKFCTGQMSMRLKVARSKRLQESLIPLLDLGPVGTVFAKALAELPLGIQPPEVMQALTDWFSLLLSGRPSTVVAGACPDYAHVNGVYTFDSLGQGVGLVAGRVLGAAIKLADFFKSRNLPVEFVVGMADHEADSPANCHRVGLSREEFRRRMRASQAALLAECAGFSIAAPFITEVGNWEAVFAEANAAVKQGCVAGPFILTAEDIAKAAETRRKLYESWHGTDHQVDVVQCLLEQIPEYITLPTILCRTYPNPLILDSGSPLMRIFMHGLSSTVRPMIGLDVGRY